MYLIYYSDVPVVYKTIQILSNWKNLCKKKFVSLGNHYFGVYNSTNVSTTSYFEFGYLVGFP